MPKTYHQRGRARGQPLTAEELELLDQNIAKLTRPQMAARLQMSPDSFDKYVKPLIKSGRLPKYKMGGFRGQPKPKIQPLPELTPEQRMERLRAAAERLTTKTHKSYAN